MAYKKGTIVYIGGFEMPDKNAAANRVLNNAKAFAELGYMVVFCGVDHDIEENAKEPIKFDGFESWPSKYSSSTREWIREQVSFKYIKGVLEKYDDVRFVIGYNMHALPLRNLENWSKKKNVKVLIDATEWYPNRLSLKFGKLIRWADTNLAMRLYQKRADGIIAISSFLENYYKKNVKNTVVIPPLVDVFEQQWHQNTGAMSKRVEFTYTGRAGNGKDVVKDKIDLIIEALVNIKSNNFHFSVVGMTRIECENMFSGISEKIIALGDSIDFYGRVSHEDSIKFLLVSDYCIFLRDQNRQNMAGFPTKFAECMTTGIGVVVNEVSDLHRYFPMDNGYLLDNMNRENIESVLAQCVENGKVRHVVQNTFHYGYYTEIFRSLLDRVGNQDENIADKSDI